MKFQTSHIFLTLFTVLLAAKFSFATEGISATTEDIARLKKDVKEGRIQVGKTRLKEIITNYGEATTIQDTEKKVVYDYGDLKIEIEKERLLRDWETDTSRKAAYTDDIDNLRRDLQSDKIVGDNISLAKIVGDYGDPTELNPSNRDGAWSIYYYGDIKLIFENTFTIKAWKGVKLDSGEPTAVEPAKAKVK